MTTYERLTLAIEQMQTRGRTTGNLRAGGVNGAVCLVGGLLLDEEIWQDDTTYHSCVSLNGEGSVTEALRVMGFTDWVDAFCWNDGVCTYDHKPTDAEVLARLEAARDRILHAEADKGAVVVEDEVGVCA